MGNSPRYCQLTITQLLTLTLTLALQDPQQLYSVLRRQPSLLSVRHQDITAVAKALTEGLQCDTELLRHLLHTEPRILAKRPGAVKVSGAQRPGE